MKEIRQIAPLPLLLLPALAGLGGASGAEAPPPLTLPEAVQRTLERHPELHHYEFLGDRLEAEGRLAGLGPGYRLGAEAENIAGTGGTEAVGRAAVTLALSSVVELGGKRQARIAAGEARLAQIPHLKQAQALDVLGDLAREYILILATQEEISLGEEALAESRAWNGELDLRLQQGGGSLAGKARGELRIARQRFRQESLQGKLDRQRAMLARFWSSLEADFSRLEGDLFALGDVPELESLLARVAASPAMESLAAQDRIDLAGIRLAQAWTRADLAWGVGLRSFGKAEDAALVLELSRPLGARGRNRDRVEAERVRREMGLHEKEVALLELRAQASSAWSQYRQLRREHRRIVEDLLPLAGRAVQTARQAYRNGQADFEEVIELGLEAQELRRARIRTAAEAQVSRAVLEQLTGEPLEP